MVWPLIGKKSWLAADNGSSSAGAYRAGQLLSFGLCPSASFRVIVGCNPAGAKNIKPGAAVRPIGGASRRSY